MSDAIEPIELLKDLIACPSITPEEGGAQALLGKTLEGLGFAVEHMVSGDAPHGPVPNLLATRGSGGPHFAFAGHTDVVPPGKGWTSDPFMAEIKGDLLYGRGAVDMKGSIAAFVAALERAGNLPGTLSFIITGDEEGPAVHGTRALMTRMAERGLHPDMILVGEPTSQNRLGDTIKIGRRGSVNMWIDIVGKQAHVAYPHEGDNPITRLFRIGTRLHELDLDDGDEWFQPSNLEVVTVDVGNPASNVIPGEAHLRLNIRFNVHHTGDALVEQVRAIVEEEAPGARFKAMVSGEAFLTEPGPLTHLVSASIAEATGVTPDLSTGGGTSDARFLHVLCPIVEFGLLNATMHKLDEAVAIADVHKLVDIYQGVLRRALS
ncbi:succinyl-diaminopimelate desuccinylase [Parasphingopyxis algicola]|uniref:succinyl-diaminopimelate desuccinylase n=1 Tax=Parasphingopyxis algicola TaxID=2026624 RepID=UPI0015A20741|nr:succinyl-diaminopimelate desuccinylase [Parasphingopyxis algicola]QLC24419.1 succinyl-diaminopimelate desuccinylase [Parasphingopyxis algicola]